MNKCIIFNQMTPSYSIVLVFAKHHQESTITYGIPSSFLFCFFILNICKYTLRSISSWQKNSDFLQMYCAWSLFTAAASLEDPIGVIYFYSVW